MKLVLNNIIVETRKRFSPTSASKYYRRNEKKVFAHDYGHGALGNPSLSAAHTVEILTKLCLCASINLYMMLEEALKRRMYWRSVLVI